MKRIVIFFGLLASLLFLTSFVTGSNWLYFKSGDLKYHAKGSTTVEETSSNRWKLKTRLSNRHLVHTYVYAAYSQQRYAKSLFKKLAANYASDAIQSEHKTINSRSDMSSFRTEQSPKAVYHGSLTVSCAIVSFKWRGKKYKKFLYGVVHPNGKNFFNVSTLCLREDDPHVKSMINNLQALN